MENREIWIKDDILFYKDHVSIEEASIQLIKYVYVQVLGNVPFLFIFSSRQHYISTHLNGFEEVYKILSNQFHFDDDIFFAVCKARKEDEKIKIWSKKMPQNYQLLDEYLNDGYFGYEVYTEPKEMVSWDTTYKQLEASSFIETHYESYGTKYLRFNYPVRIEGVLIDQLEVYADNIIPDRPVQEFFVNLYNETNTDNSYKELRELWIDTTADISKYGYERNDQCYLQFVLAKGIEASICYTYDDEYGYDDGSTSFHIYNKREYNYFLENKEYEEIIEVSDFISFNKVLDLNIKYIDNDAVKNVPLKVQKLLKNKSGIWIDSVNKKIGFVGIDTALILDIDKISHFVFQNVLPAKGAGYADFMVYLKNGKHLYVFTEDTYCFDQFEKKLFQITNKEIKIPEAYYNC
ncbi:hypothetical protein [Chishuiella sp.]|uniref:hypothetical protein n=1 Tax=Chishuiella sp. TaxID=1969467 RepID=UPI0028A8C1E2|nr:hypothetical protein [Chishuiella sp.]